MRASDTRSEQRVIHIGELDLQSLSSSGLPPVAGFGSVPRSNHRRCHVCVPRTSVRSPTSCVADVADYCGLALWKTPLDIRGRGANRRAATRARPSRASAVFNPEQAVLLLGIDVDRHVAKSTGAPRRAAESPCRRVRRTLRCHRVSRTASPVDPASRQERGRCVTIFETLRQAFHAALPFLSPTALPPCRDVASSCPDVNSGRCNIRSRNVRR